MRLLNSREYRKLNSLIVPLNYHLVLKSIIHGYTNAHVYVDNLTNPRTAFLWNKGKVWLLGMPYDNIATSLVEVIEKYQKYLREHDADYFRLHYNKAWAPHISTIFNGLRCEEFPRSYYHIDARVMNLRVNPPQGIKITQVDEDLISSNYKNLERVLDEMSSECVSVAAFLERYYAYAALDGDTIVSWCMSEYNTGSSCELGIETIDNYQRRGLATQVARAVIGHALKNEIYNIGWHSWKRNLPSVKTAMKIGFKHKIDYPIQEIWINTNARA